MPVDEDSGANGQYRVTGVAPGGASARRARTTHYCRTVMAPTPADEEGCTGAPSVIRIGVTGHRTLADVDQVRTRVVTAVSDARDVAGADIVEIWSSLAEGADRIVADLVPARADRLIVVLPLDPDDYRSDFTSDASCIEFDRLLALATEIRVARPDDSGTRESAYERAGLEVLANCDLLLALWDGDGARGRGGTAEIVERARRDGVAVTVIDAERPNDTAPNGAAS